MTKKDYVLLASAISNAMRFAQSLGEVEELHDIPDYLDGRVSGVMSTYNYIADTLRRDNQNFDAHKFFKACFGDKK